MREFLSMIIMPLPVLFLALLTASVFLILKRKRTGRCLLFMAGIWFLMITTPPIPQALVKSLENRYSQFNETGLMDHTDSYDIIVLGGGHSDDRELSPNNQLSADALGRLVEGIRIHRLIPGSRIMLSGYGGKSGLPQAVVLYRTALMLGIDSASMAVQTAPANTRQEAEEYAGNYGRNRKLIVVTNDMHIPRAMMLFRKAGLDPIAAPTNQILKYGSHKYRWRWIPSSENIGMLEEAIHEYAGIVWTLVEGDEETRGLRD